MKKYILLFLFTSLCFSQGIRNAQGVGAGYSDQSMPGSAILEARSTTKGFLPPRMTTTQRDLISSPATGLMIYNITTGTYNGYNGTSWVAVGAGSTNDLNTTMGFGNFTEENLQFNGGAYIDFYDGVRHGTLNGIGLSANRDWSLPNASGTLPISFNGTVAGSNGNIDWPVNYSMSGVITGETFSSYIAQQINVLLLRHTSTETQNDSQLFFTNGNMIISKKSMDLTNAQNNFILQRQDTDGASSLSVVRSQPITGTYYLATEDYVDDVVQDAQDVNNLETVTERGNITPYQVVSTTGIQYDGSGDTGVEILLGEEGFIVKTNGFYATTRSDNLTAPQSFQYPDNSGTFALAELTVPYVGATDDVNLGDHSMTLNDGTSEHIVNKHGSFMTSNGATLNTNIQTDGSTVNFYGESSNGDSITMGVSNVAGPIFGGTNSAAGYTIKATNLTGSNQVNLEVPNKSTGNYTIATTDDISVAGDFQTVLNNGFFAQSTDTTNYISLDLEGGLLETQMANGEDYTKFQSDDNIILLSGGDDSGGNNSDANLGVDNGLIKITQTNLSTDEKTFIVLDNSITTTTWHVPAQATPGDYTFASTGDIVSPSTILTSSVTNGDTTHAPTGDAVFDAITASTQTITLTSDVTGSGTGSFATTISNDAVTNAKSANMATQTIKGRNTAGTGDPEDLTKSQVQGILGLPSSSTDNIIPRFDGTSGNLQVSNISIDDNGGINVAGVAGSTYSTKKLEYDTTLNQWIAYDNDSSTSLNLGYETWFTCTNTSGSSIPNGSVVYISGSSSGIPTIALAKADAASTSVGIGITTETIANGSTGKVTQSGLVNGMNTSGLTAGAVYVSETTAGALTNTVPVAPNYRMRVGFVGVINASTGTILVTPSTATLGNGSASQLLRINSGGTAQEWFTPSYASISGGTTGFIQKQTGTNTLGNSAVADDGTNIGLGVTTMSGKIHLKTDNISSVTNTAGGVYLENTTAATAVLDQISPPIVSIASGWKSNATAASQTVGMKTQVEGRQMSSLVGLRYNWYSMQNGGTWSPTGTYIETDRFGTTAIFSNGATIAGSISGITASLAKTNPASSNDMFAITGNYQISSGTNYDINLIGSINPTSGTHVTNGIAFQPTINQTGGANGRIRGYYFNPTVTAAADLVAIETTSGKVILANTNTTAGTTGAQTINKTSGTVNFAASATSLVVTNNLVTTSSLVFVEIRTNDTTAVIKNVVPGSGSFTITMATAPTAETSVGFLVIN